MEKRGVQKNRVEDYCWLIGEGIYWQHVVLLSSAFFSSTFSSAFFFPFLGI
jgi:hypothetical protein